MLLALKLKLALAAAVSAVPLVASTITPTAIAPLDAFVEIAQTDFDYRPAGDFWQAGRQVSAPLKATRLTGPLVIMKHQVTVREYGACIDNGGCPKLAMPDPASDLPMVGVNWHDATAYAAWMTRKTGRLHRLPTDREWTFAAAEMSRDEPLKPVDPSDLAQAWIARYEAEANRAQPDVLKPQPVGTFGVNSNGLADVAGNVWEWTETCFIRATVEGSQVRTTNTNCGVRVVAGAHRSYMTDFIRDPRNGGCAAGVPPVNLGFRLVVEQPPTLMSKLRFKLRDISRV